MVHLVDARQWPLLQIACCLFVVGAIKQPEYFL